MAHTDSVTQARGPAEGDLSIGDLARRSGVSAAVLRTWETRHGFPVPKRLESGHRRYAIENVDLVKQVLRRKDSGVRLEVAISEITTLSAPAAPSIFAELRRRHPGIAVHRLHKSTLIALSRAIEDECCAKADRPVLFGAFQRGDFFAPAAERWTELARVSREVIVFADDWSEIAETPGGPMRAVLDEAAPLRREWAVICDAGEASACLSAWELPGQAGVRDRERIYESVWTVDPAVVRDAARVAASVAVGCVPARDAGRVDALLGDLMAPDPRPAPSSDAVVALLNRVVAYVDRAALGQGSGHGG